MLESVHSTESLLTTPIAKSPWLRRLDGMELWTALLSSPWLQPKGIRVAALERELAGLASRLPLGTSRPR